MTATITETTSIIETEIITEKKKEAEIPVSTSTEFYFPNGHHVNLKDYPPTLVIWIYHTLDILCMPFNCTNKWRHSILPRITRNTSVLENSWFAPKYQLPSLTNDFPPLISYTDYMKQHLQQRQYDSNERSMITSNSNMIQMKDYIQLTYHYAFQTPSTALCDVTTSTSMLVILLFLFLLRKLKHAVLLPYFSRIGTTVAISSHGPEWIRHNEERVLKFGEYCFRLLYHLMIAVYGVYYFYGTESWWDDMIHCYQGYPYQPIQPTMAWYYILQCTYNIDAFASLLEISCTLGYRLPIVINNTNSTTTNNTTTTKHDTNNAVINNNSNAISNNHNSTSASGTTSNGTISNNNSTTNNRTGKNNHKHQKKRNMIKIKFHNNQKYLIVQSPLYVIWKDTVRGDFSEMFIHHMATNLLVMGSSFFRITRTGSMVFLIHDISDVPVDLSKLANFVKWKVTTVVCFLTMAVVWLYTRLYIFPVIIFYGSIQKSYFSLQSGGLSPLTYLCYSKIFYVAMGLLILLHALWFTIFVRIFYSMVFKREIHDYSEHKQGEDTPTTTTTTDAVGVVGDNDDKKRQ